MNKRFWPSVFGGPIAEDEQHLFSYLVAWEECMGISDPVEVQKILQKTHNCHHLLVAYPEMPHAYIGGHSQFQIEFFNFVTYSKFLFFPL